MGFSKVECETILVFNEAGPTASIYTCNPRWIRQLERYKFKIIHEYADKGGVYAKEFEVPKQLIRVPRPPTKKELAQRRTQAERVRKYRFSRQNVGQAWRKK